MQNTSRPTDLNDYYTLIAKLKHRQVVLSQNINKWTHNGAGNMFLTLWMRDIENVEI